VVHPPPHVSLERTPHAVVPERELPALARVVLAKHVHEPPLPDALQGRPGLGMEVHVLLEALRVMDVDLLWGNVEVPAPEEGLPRREVAGEVVPHPREPLQLVREEGGVHGLPLGDVRVDDRDPLHRGLDQARLVRGAAVVEPAADGRGLSPAGQGDPGVGLLPAEHDVVAPLPKERSWELVVLDFCLLEAEGVRFLLGEPGGDDGEPGADGVRVERGDLEHRPLYPSALSGWTRQR